MTTMTDSAARDSPPSMVDVARHAGVALGTVSNVLNNPTKVAESTRARVLASIETLGFVRNSLARSLAAGRADTVGFVIVDIGNSFFVDIARGAQAAFQERGMKLLLANSDVDIDSQNGYLDLFDEARVSGILLAPLDAPLGGAAKVRSHGRPVVLANWAGETDKSCGVVVDEQLGGYIATRHLLESGRTRLLFAGGPLTLHAVEQRYAGALRAVSEWGAGATLELLETRRLTVPAGLDVGHAIVNRNPDDRPDGIFASADALASGCVQALIYGGINVPDDISVIGYDNNHFASDSVVPISTVGQPGIEMGRIAAQLLLEETSPSQPHEHRTIVLEPTLFPRASTRMSVHPAS
jgi:LacI family transcriptional regulator